MLHLVKHPKIISILVALLFCITLQATHNRAGEITYEQIGPLKVRATITTYTKASSASADRDSVEILWGDGKKEFIGRMNGPDNNFNGYQDGELLENDTKKNIYIAEHTYPGPSHYILSMQDPNRNGNIINFNAPNSDRIEFFIQTTLTLFSGQFQGFNSSPILLQPPVDVGCVGVPFIHNPNAYDADGDSLVYELITPLRDVNVQVPNYQFPEEIIPGADNTHSLNAVTGDFLWTSPQRSGEYNIAMRIIEYRHGLAIDTLIRDMQILIEECENMPPEIETEDEICVVAGEILAFDVIATDPDIDPVQLVKLSALGGPFQVAINPATFEVTGSEPDVYGEHPLFGRFEWKTTCEHISSQYYSVVFKAVDNFDKTNLTTLKTVRIKVVGPAPEDVQAIPETDLITVSWENPYACDMIADDYFRGFSVWRREGSNNFDIDTCSTGLEGRGYTQIGFDTQEMADGRYVFLDMDVERGRTYCYRILGEFSKLSIGGQPFNRVSSLPSVEICVQLNRDIPLLTNVDVETTDINDGAIIVRWTKPKAEDLDTLLNAGPYRYELQRGLGLTPADYQPVPGADFTSPTFGEANDTMFIDMGLNTLENPYSYQLAFYVNDEAEPLGLTSTASSIFLTISPTDEANVLSWTEDVPWDNYEYTIYRREPSGTTFDSLTTVDVPSYRDEGLINGEEYCYYVKSSGSYGVEGIMSPLVNRSQRVCETPFDNVPPCPPPLVVSNICDDENNNNTQDFINNLLWVNPENNCEDVDDVAAYNIYYAVSEDAEYSLIEMITTPTDTTYEHSPDLGLLGCYAVTAIDSVGNESAFSNIVCKVNCPLYELPNVFTPNGDGANELFIPYPYRFIAAVDMKIFNRWGNLVFETSDPALNWNGTNRNGKVLAEGVYYYTCAVFEQRANGATQNAGVLNGYIEIVIGKQ